MRIAECEIAQLQANNQVTALSAISVRQLPERFLENKTNNFGWKNDANTGCTLSIRCGSGPTSPRRSKLRKLRRTSRRYSWTLPRLRLLVAVINRLVE